jgi:hypothetical protein
MHPLRQVSLCQALPFAISADRGSELLGISGDYVHARDIRFLVYFINIRIGE